MGLFLNIFFNFFNLINTNFSQICNIVIKRKKNNENSIYFTFFNFSNLKNIKCRQNCNSEIERKKSLANLAQ